MQLNMKQNLKHCEHPAVQFHELKSISYIYKFSRSLFKKKFTSKSSFIRLFAQGKLKENVDMKEELNNSEMCYLTSWQWRMSQEIKSKCKNKGKLANSVH